MKKMMKNLTGLTLVAFGLFAFTACGEGPAETTGNTATEDMVDGADGGLDSLELPADTTGTR